MNRREFLLAGVAVCASGPALAQMKMKGPGMSGMGGMPVLPEGAPLRELPRLANMATDGGRFEAKLTAGPAKMRFANGLDTPILAYNGESPGPMIEVTEGDRVRIAFRNAIPNQASTIHWHGMMVPNEMDGVPLGTQYPVGFGQTFQYLFRAQPAGTTS